MKQRKSNTNLGPTFLTASWDAWKAARGGKQGIGRRQQERLQTLVSYARTHSRYFADVYRDVPEPCTDVSYLPVVTKAELMRHFDDWVTDPAVTKQQVEAFIADPALIGHDYLDRYVVCTTSGSTGIPAILVHDHGALVVYNVLGYIRSLPVFFSSLRNLGALLRGRGRLAAVFVTGGHFLGNVMSARRSRKMPWRAKTQRIFSALTLLPELVRELNAFQPVMLGGYPSALEVLAKEQEAGRLQIHPVAINAAGETLTTEPLKLRVRLAVKEMGEEQSVWEALQARLAAYLAEQGIAHVSIEKAPEPPQLHPKSGKFRQVWSEVEQQVPDAVS